MIVNDSATVQSSDNIECYKNLFALESFTVTFVESYYGLRYNYESSRWLAVTTSIIAASFKTSNIT